MTANSLLEKLLGIKGASVCGFDLEMRDGEVAAVKVHARVWRRHRWRCPVCGRRCPVHDYVCGERFWRGMDFGPVAMWIGASVPRVRCPGHGVLTAAVPWAKPGSGFTLDFAYSAAWMVKAGLSKSKTSEYLRIDWKTVGGLVELVWRDLEPDVGARFDGLVRIGVDETSFKKGHSYITTVVNHDTNTVVWASEGFGKEVVERFFEMLTPEQRASIEVVSGDGARFITDSVAKYCPNAVRCLDPFHVVEWANVALDAVRVDAWRRALAELAEMKKGGGEARKAKKAAEEIKRAKYALGKNPENLTERQRERLSVLQMSDAGEAGECLGKWIAWARRCRIPAFVELQRKIGRHHEHILNTIRCDISNARVEALNNKIKLLIRIAYGFRNTTSMIALVMLFCSNIKIPWPGRQPQNDGQKESEDGAAG